MKQHYIRRCNQIAIEESIKSPFVTALLGPRRVGKSTVLEHLTEKLPNEKKLFFNMDSRQERNSLENNNFQTIIEQRLLKPITPGNLTWVIIDEAQKFPPLFEQVKILYDKYKNQSALKFILTGSSSLSLHQLSAESLAGRIQLLKLREFNLQETCSLQIKKPISYTTILEDLFFKYDHKKITQKLAELTPFKVVLTNALQTQLLYGGLPEVLLLQTKEERLQYLANYLQTYLEKDILVVQTISDLKLYQKLMGILAEQTGSLRDDQKIINALQCSRETIKKYRDMLAVTLLYEEIYPYIGSTLKRLVKSPKGYLINNGLISYITNLHDIKALVLSGLIGHRFENWILKEFRIVLDRYPYNTDINYWRTSSGVEIDFIINTQTAVIPIEVTYNDQVDNKKIRNLKIFLQDEKKAAFGVVIYNGDFIFDTKNRIYYLPAWAVG